MYGIDTIKPTYENHTKLANKIYGFVSGKPTLARRIKEYFWADEKKALADVYDFAFTPGAWDIELFAENLQSHANRISRGWKYWVEVGEKLHRAHRTIQRTLVEMCLGILVGLSKQEYTDARNEHAIATAKKVAQLVEDGELNIGAFI